MDQHTAIEYAPGELEREWTLHATPAYYPTRTPRRAVALDCEMGVSVYGDPELVRISLVDFFTGEILLDSLVYPRVRLLHLNTRYSGVTRGMLEGARQRNQCIRGGRDGAREQVWRYVGQETIVVVHGGSNDLLALRWKHERIIDTFVVEGQRRQRQQQQQQQTAASAAGEAAMGGRSLKHLAEAMLGVSIQRGSLGLDSVEDAMACRWLVDWYVRRGGGG